MLLDAIMAAGSNPAVMYLKESIVNQRLSRTESIQALSGLPLYIRTPTPELLNELLVTNSKIFPKLWKLSCLFSVRIC
jgi:hypothetical protein